MADIYTRRGLLSVILVLLALLALCESVRGTDEEYNGDKEDTSAALIKSDGLTQNVIGEYDHHGAWAVSFHDDFDYAEENKKYFDDMANEMASKHGMLNLGQILPGTYLFSHDCEADNKHHCGQRLHRRDKEMTGRLGNEKGVLWTEQQRPRRRYRRAATVPKFTDPLFGQQWHLHNTEHPGKDMNIIPVWNAGITGKGVRVSVIDDGLEQGHSDLKDNFEPSCSYDFNFNSKNVTPRYKDSNGRLTNINNHGTRCAGVIAGGINNSCGVGVAYNSKICGVKIIDGSPDDRMESNAFSYGIDSVDIYSSSWGPNDDGKTVEGPLKLAQQALRYGVQKGRKGKGAVYVFASGNGGSYQDDCNCDGYTNSIHTLTIGSVDTNGRIPHYAESCAAHFAVTYSSSRTSGKAIATCDIRESCTSRHTGTSASAPMAAGMIALLLEANPNLTYRDVQHVVANSAKPLDDIAKDGWITNAAGRKFHLFFGFGLMDAQVMVTVGKKWKNVGPRISYTSKDMVVKDKFKGGVVKKYTALIEDKKGTGVCEHIEATVTLEGPQRGSISIFLTSPGGTRIQLLRERRSDQHSDLKGWTLTSTAFWDERVAGEWALEVSKKAGSGGFVEFKEWSLSVHGREGAAKKEVKEKIPKPEQNPAKASSAVPVKTKTDASPAKTTVPAIPKDTSIPASTSNATIPTSSKPKDSSFVSPSGNGQTSSTVAVHSTVGVNTPSPSPSASSSVADAPKGKSDVDGKAKEDDPQKKKKSENSNLGMYITISVISALILCIAVVACMLSREGQNTKANYRVSETFFELGIDQKESTGGLPPSDTNGYAQVATGDDLEDYNINDSYYASNQFFRDRSKRRDSGSSSGSSHVVYRGALSEVSLPEVGADWDGDMDKMPIG
eukprot:Nk52_evm9s1178 gene=Nk52_evmTU9s1178